MLLCLSDGKVDMRDFSYNLSALQETGEVEPS